MPIYTNEDLDFLTQELYKSYSQLYQKELAKIGKRIKDIGDLRPTEIHKLNALKDIYADVAQIKRDLAKITNKTVGEIDKVLMSAAANQYTGAKELYNHRNIPFVPIDKNPIMLSLAAAISKETARSFLNLSNTTGNLLAKDYKSLVDEAVKAVASGTSSYSTEMYSILKDSPLGLKVQYDSGYKRRLDSALRQNIIDGSNAIYKRIEEQMGEELGFDGVEITAHNCPAPDHAPYQGKQYSNKEYEALQNSLHRKIDTWNCRHKGFGIILGVSQPVYDDKTLNEYRAYADEKVNIDGKDYTRYEVTQLQRKFETKIRDSKEKQVLAKACGNEELMSKCQRDVTVYTTKYRQITAKAGLENKLASRGRVQGYRRGKINPLKTEDNFSALNYNSKNDKINMDYVPITTKSMKNVPFVKFDMFDDSQCAKIKQFHKDLLMFTQQYDLGVEAIAYYDMDLNLLTRYRGMENTVQGIKVNVPHIVLHTHPAPLTFTHTDIKTFIMKDNTKILTALCNDGTVYALEKTSKYDRDGILNSLIKAFENVTSENITPEEYVDLIEKFLGKVGNYGTIYYK